MPLSEENLVKVLLREQPRLLAFLQALVRRDGVAEDLFQDLSLRAVRSREQIDNEEHFVHWLYRAARNRAIDELRRAKLPTLDTQVIDQLVSSWTDAPAQDGSDRSDALRQCVERLQPNARKLIQWRYDEGLTGEEIAERTLRKTSAIYMQISRVRRFLQQCVEATLRGPASGGGQ